MGEDRSRIFLAICRPGQVKQVSYRDMVVVWGREGLCEFITARPCRRSIRHQARYQQQIEKETEAWLIGPAVQRPYGDKSHERRDQRQAQGIVFPGPGKPCRDRIADEREE